MRMSDWSSDVCSSDLVFCRFSGCNLWSGREADRTSAICQFCDTDFVGIEGVGGGRFSSADALAEAIEVAWAGAAEQRFVVFTGGEPLLQVNAELIRSEEHTSELQSLMRNTYAVFCLKKKIK